MEQRDRVRSKLHNKPNRNKSIFGAQILGGQIRRRFRGKSFDLSGHQRPCWNSPLRERATNSKLRLTRMNCPMVFLLLLQRRTKREEVGGGLGTW